MVYLVVEQWYPPNKSSEVGKFGLEAIKKYPEDKSVGKMLVDAAVFTDKDGFIHILSIAQSKPGKVKETMDLASNRCIMIAKAVEGYRYHMHSAYEMVEALQIIGLQPPAP
jgi:hypothetical protein